MNVGLFTETYYPEINGVATSVFMLKTELEKMGLQVYVFTTTSPGTPEFEHNVFRVPSLPCIFITERRVGMFYSPKLAHIIKKLDLDVIHTHTEFSLGIFGRIMAKELRLPIVHTYHTIYEDYTHYINRMHIEAVEQKAKAFMRMFSKISCNTAETVVVPTVKVKKLLESYLVVKAIEVIPTGIDLNKFKQNYYDCNEIRRLRLSYGVEDDEKLILSLGRVSSEKNIEEILRVMPEYMKRHENVKFMIVGDGPDLERLMKLAKTFPFRDRILFTGSQAWDKIGIFYQMGDVFVSASKSETQGLTFIEAMASSLPVVAKKDPCLDGILEEGYNGYTFESAWECMEGLDQVLFSTQDIDYCNNAARKVAKYSTAQFAAKIEQVYERMLRVQIQGSELPIR
ncbi:MAG: glycosyltransferase [Velocimicrobium sp.]